MSDLSKVSKKIGKIIESAFITNSFDVTICLRKQFGSMVNSIFIEENSKGLICTFFKKSTKRLRRHKNYGRNVLQCNGFHKMIPDVIENGLEPLVLVWTTNKSVTFCIEDFFIFHPIFKKKYTRWGDKWNLYKTKKPLLNEDKKTNYPKIYEEAETYNWITYVKLK